jgi:hypothetical protein
MNPADRLAYPSVVDVPPREASIALGSHAKLAQCETPSHFPKVFSTPRRAGRPFFPTIHRTRHRCGPGLRLQQTRLLSIYIIMSLDIKLALNAEIVKASAVVDGSTPVGASSPKTKSSYKKSSTTEWNVASETGTFQGEHWPSHLPRPPSRKKLLDDSSHSTGHRSTNSNNNNSNIPTVVVFNANTHEGSSLVRVLSEKGLKVTAVVRVFTSRNTKQLIKLKNVVVKVADLNNAEAVYQAAVNCQQAFLVTKYWERFENAIEEQMAKVVLGASATAGITRLVLATFEDTKELRLRNRKSQLMPTVDGRIFPKFTGMEGIDHMGKMVGVSITHMFTSFLDENDNDGGGKKSIILIRGDNGKIVLQEHDPSSKK